MTYDEAMQAARLGNAVRPKHFGPGWTVQFSGGEFWDVNPVTGTLLLHRANATCRADTWSIAAPRKPK